MRGENWERLRIESCGLRTEKIWRTNSHVTEDLDASMEVTIKLRFLLYHDKLADSSPSLPLGLSWNQAGIAGRRIFAQSQSSVKIRTRYLFEPLEAQTDRSPSNLNR
jgi:hypothetical protein